VSSILVVEDDDLVRDMLQKVLCEEQFDVHHSPNGIEAMTIMNKHEPNLVITDLIMPEKNGLAVIREIRKHYPKVKIIAISGGGREGPENYLKNALIEGASYVFAKPVERSVLLDAIKELIKMP
jgi:CheY-like chemotaxis protein